MKQKLTNKIKIPIKFLNKFRNSDNSEVKY